MMGKNLASGYLHLLQFAAKLYQTGLSAELSAGKPSSYRTPLFRKL